MPLTLAQIATLTSLVHANRDGHGPWDKAGILKHVEQLAADPRPFDQLEQQAIAASANPKATTPAAILWTTPVRTADRANDGWKTRPGPCCPNCGDTRWRVTDEGGEWACQWQERLGIGVEVEQGRPDVETTVEVARG